MADFIDDFDDLREGQKAALGGKMQRAINRQEKKQSIQEQINYIKNKNENGLNKEDVKLLKEISSKLESRVDKFLGKAIQEISPVVRTELKQISQLLDTGSKTDENLAMQKLEQLQTKFNADLKLFNRGLGSNFDKLKDIVEQLKQQQEEKIEKAKQTQTELLQQGIKTQIVKGNLQYLSPQQLRKLEIEANKSEKEIQVIEKRLDVLLKTEGTGKGGAFSEEQNKRIKSTQARLNQEKSKLEERRNLLGPKSEIVAPSERKIGTLEGIGRSAASSFVGGLDPILGIGTDIKNLGNLFFGLSKGVVNFGGKLLGFGNVTEKITNTTKDYLKSLKDGILPTLKKLNDAFLLMLKNVVGKISKGIGGLFNMLGMNTIGGALTGFGNRMSGGTATRVAGTAGRAGVGIVAGEAAAGVAAGVAPAAAAGGAGAAAGAGGLMALLPEILPVILAIVAIVGAGVGLMKLFGGSSKIASAQNLQNPNVDAMGNQLGPSAAIKPLEEKTLTRPSQMNNQQLSTLSTETVGQQMNKNNVVVAPTNNTVLSNSTSNSIMNPDPFNRDSSFINLMGMPVI